MSDAASASIRASSRRSSIGRRACDAQRAAATTRSFPGHRGIGQSGRFADLAREEIGTMRLSRKQLQRQQLEILTDEAESLDGLQVRYLPTYRDLKCICGHIGRARIPRETKAPQFRCTKCGRRN
jgi:hypothetical protein